MKKQKEQLSSEPPRKLKPAASLEARENQMIAYAVDLAEQQLINGTASAQVITHYLKLGSSKERLEQEILQRQKELTEAKIKALQSADEIKELYSSALIAMREYSGGDPSHND